MARDSLELFDDCSSFCGSEYTHSSSSTVWGPGALTGKFLKAFGEKSLDLVVSVRIRIRLASIKQTLEKHPKVFIDPQTPGEWQQLKEIYDDLKELCRRDRYSLSLRRTAANIIREIFLATRSSPGKQASPIHHLWRALLVRLQSPGEVLSIPPETVITVGPQELEPSHGPIGQESTNPTDPGKRIEIGIKIETTHSYEPANGFFKRRLPFLNRRTFGHRQKRKLDGHKWRCDLNGSLLPLSEPVGIEISHDNEPTSKFSGSHPRHVWNKTQHSAHSRHIPKPTSGHPRVNDIGFDPECLRTTSDHTQEKPIVEDTFSHLSPDTNSMCQLNDPVLSRHCRLASDIQHDLDQARKLVQDLENELLHSIQQTTSRE